MELEGSDVGNMKQVCDVGRWTLKRQRSANMKQVCDVGKRQRLCRCCRFQYTSDVDNMKQVCDVGSWTLKRQISCTCCSFDVDNMKQVCVVGSWTLKKQRSFRRSTNPTLPHEVIESWTLKKQRSFRRSTNPTLPHEVIEIILSGLPVKDLLRFKVVCKQWEATISDPVFAEIHLQRPKKMLLASDCWKDDYRGLHVFELQDNYCIEFVSTIDVPEGVRGEADCSCDGLYLKKRIPVKGDGQPKFVLWNPSCRTYRVVYGPQSVDLRSMERIQGMYYDPSMKDYKIVIADMEHYAVYSCRDNKWGDTKEMEGFLGEHCPRDGFFFNGSIYWLAVTFLNPMRTDRKLSSVICFDCKNEDFKRLPLPYIKNLEEKYLQLTSFGGHLCLLIAKREFYSYSKIKIMKKVNSIDEWMESKEECLCNFRPMNGPKHLCVLSENEILLELMRRTHEEMEYVVYDKSKNTLVKTSGNHPPSWIFPPFAYRENLFML